MIVAPYHCIWADAEFFFFCCNAVGFSVETALAVNKVYALARLNSTAYDINIIIDFILLMCLSGSFAYVASLLVIKFIANGGM